MKSTVLSLGLGMWCIVVVAIADQDTQRQAMINAIETDVMAAELE